MKAFIVFTLIIAGISADLPPQLKKGLLTSDERLITDTIASLIEDITQRIKNSGLDPYSVPLEEASYALPVPVLFDFFGQVKEFHCKGLSNIHVTRLTFATLTLRLRLDLKLPLIEATLDDASIAAIFFGENINMSASGRLAVEDIVVETDIRMRIGLSGISVNSVVASLKIGAIKPNLKVSGFGRDVSPFLNRFIGTVIPNTLNKFEGDINKLLEFILYDFINYNL